MAVRPLRCLLLALAVLGLPVPVVWAQDTLGRMDAASATCTANVTCVEVQSASAGVGVELTGTWAGTIEFESSLRGGVWVAQQVTPQGSSTQVTNATTNGFWSAQTGGGRFRVRFSAYTSGTAQVAIRPLSNPPAAPSTASISGGVTIDLTSTNSLLTTGNAQTDTLEAILGATTDAASAAGGTGSVSAKLREISAQLAGTLTVTGGGSSDATAANQVTQITALQLIDNLPNTIGSTTSGQSGVLGLGAVTTSAPTYTTGQSAPLSVDTTGALRVTGISGGGGGGASDVDNSSFVLGTDGISPSGFLFDDVAPGAVTENFVGVSRMSGNRVQYGILRDAAGNERGVNVNSSNQLTVAEGGALLTAAQLIDNLPNTLGSTTSGQSGALALAAVTTNAPTYTTGQSNALSLNTGGSLRTTCDNCGTGPTDTDDGTIAGAQTGGLSFALNYVWDGTTWVRATNADSILDSIVPSNGPLMTGRGSTATPTAMSADNDSTAVWLDLFGRVHIAAEVAEDVASANADVGMRVYAIRDDTLDVRSGTEGDYEPLHTTAAGALWVQDTSSNLIGSTTSGQRGQLSFGAVTTAAPTYTTAQSAPLSLDTTGALRVTGISGGGGVSVNEDVASAGADPGTPAYSVRSDTIASTTSANGDYQPLKSTAVGSQWVTLASSAGTELTPASDQTLDAAIGTTGPLMTGRGSIATPTAMSADGDATAVWLDLNGRVHLVAETQEDVASGDGQNGMRMLAVRDDTLGAFSGTNGDYEFLHLNAKGALWTSMVDPCSSVTKLFVNINQATGTQLFTGTASNRTYVCGFNLVTATAQNIALVSGTGTVCATGTAGMMGGTTAATGWNFAANGGIGLAAANASYTKSGANADNVCLLQSSTGQISGVISYVVAP